MNAADTVYEAIIVGGGPAGMSAALILGRCRRRVLVVDAGEGRNAAAVEMHGYLGHDGISPQSLRNVGRGETIRYGIEWLKDTVVKAEAAACEYDYPTCFRLETQSGRQLVARKLVFATGMKDELPDFPGVRECYGASVHHCPFCDGYAHSGERIVVYGSSPSGAVGLAINVRTWSGDVTVLANGQKLSTADEQRLLASGIVWRTEPIIRFLHDGRQLKGVELAGFGVLAADAMFFNTDQQSQCDLPKGLGVTCDDGGEGPVRTNRKQRTNVPGVLLAGDADGNVQFAIVAAAEGAVAATVIHRELLEEDEARRKSSLPARDRWPS